MGLRNEEAAAYIPQWKSEVWPYISVGVKRGRGAARLTCTAAAGPLRDCESFFAWMGLRVSKAIRPSSKLCLHVCRRGLGSHITQRRVRLNRLPPGMCAL